MIKFQTLRGSLGSIHLGLCNLRKDRRGIAATEFAMILPILVTLFLGSVELSEGISVDRRVTSIASATADLVAQFEQVTDSDLADIVKISKNLVGTYDSNNLNVTISSVVIDPDGAVKIAWSYGDSARAADSTYSDLPVGLQIPNTSVILSEVSYSFTPTVGLMFAGQSISLDEKFHLKPRRSNTVVKN